MMNLKSFCLLLCLSFCLTSSLAFAGTGVEVKEGTYGKQYLETTLEGIIKKYKHITPKVALEHLREAREYYYKVGPKKAYKEFQKFPSRWYTGMQEMVVMVMDCGTMDLPVYPVPGLTQIRKIKGVMKKLRDRTGRLSAVVFCEEAKKNYPHGAFARHENTFQGLKFTVPTYLVGIPIKGTQIYIGTNYVNPNGTQDELNKLLREGKL